MFDQIREITFKISPYCNLDCVYCFQKYSTKTEKDIFDIEEDLFNFIKKLPLGETLEFKITGGESSLFCNEIERVFKKLKKIERYKETRVFATTITNGTNLEGVIDLMDRGIFDPDGCKFSWDGIYSASRSRKPKNTYYGDKFFNDKIELLGKSKYKDKMLVRTAITPDTIDDLYDSVKFLLDSGCTKWEYYLLTDCDAYRDESFQNRFRYQLEKISKLIELYPNFNFYNWDTMYFSKHVVKETKEEKLRSIGCRHLGTSLYVSKTGKLYPCGFFTDDSLYEDSRLIIGDIYEGFDYNTMKSFVEEYYKQPMCEWKTCKNKQCFECPALSKYRKGSLNEKLMQACRIRDIELEIFNDSYDKGLYAKYTTEKENKIIKAFSYTDTWSEVKELNKDLPFK